MKKWCLIIGGIILAIFLCIYFFSESEYSTIPELREAFISDVNEALMDPNNEIRKRIESAHKTVTVKKAYISSCTIRTIDGSNNTGKNYSNIAEVDFTVHTAWDGVFHKNGYTDLQIVLDCHNGEVNVKKAGIVDTNAWVNTEDPEFWYAVGVAVGTLLL